MFQIFTRAGAGQLQIIDYFFGLHIVTWKTSNFCTNHETKIVVVVVYGFGLVTIQPGLFLN
jgi:hypothetical protein